METQDIVLDKVNEIISMLHDIDSEELTQAEKQILSKLEEVKTSIEEPKVFSEKQVMEMLVALLMFSNANQNQGLSKIKGNTFGEQAKTIINVTKSIEGAQKSILSIINQLR